MSAQKPVNVQLSRAANTFLENKTPDLDLGITNASDDESFPGSFEGSSCSSTAILPDSDIGAALLNVCGKTASFIEGAKDKTTRAALAADKFSALMESIDIDQVRGILEDAKKISPLGGSFADVISEALEYIKDPSQWLKYAVPILLGVGVYLIIKEKDATLLPIMKAVCVAGAAYFLVPDADKLLQWFAHLSEFQFQGAEKLFGPMRDLLVEEESMLSTKLR